MAKERKERNGVSLILKIAALSLTLLGFAVVFAMAYADVKNGVKQNRNSIEKQQEINKIIVRMSNRQAVIMVHLKLDPNKIPE